LNKISVNILILQRNTTDPNNNNNNNNNNNSSMGMGEVVHLQGVDPALVLTNPALQ
jgi:hypothetical protein